MAEPIYTRIAGALYKLREPINPRWKPTPVDMVFSGQFAGGERVLNDPSNADANHPARSPAGFPLVYGNEPDGNGGIRNSDRLPARVLFDGQTHDNDAAVDTYIARVAQRDANLANEDKAIEQDENVLHPDQIHISLLNGDDLLFYGYHRQQLAGKVGPLSLDKLFVQWWEYGSEPLAELPATARILNFRKPGTWDETPYQGPLRALLG